MANKDEEGVAIGVFKTYEPIILEMAPNGGWVVSQGGDPRCHPQRLGAYSTAEDMLSALASALDRRTAGEGDTLG